MIGIVPNNDIFNPASGDITQYLRAPDIRLVGLEFENWVYEKPFIIEKPNENRAYFYLVKRGGAWFRTGPGADELHFISAGMSVGVEGHKHQWMDQSHIHKADYRNLAKHPASPEQWPVEISASSIDRGAAVLQRLPHGAIIIPHNAQPFSQIISGCDQLLKIELGQKNPSAGVTRRLSEIIMLQIIGYARSRLFDGLFSNSDIGHDEYLLRAMTAFFGDPSAGWTVELLAQEAGLSRAAFSERFTRSFSEPPMRLLNRLRLAQAAEMLTQSSATLLEIAAKVGFGSAPAFARAFTRQYGKTPGEWRKLSRESE